MTNLPESVPAPGRAAYSWTQMADLGLLWLINRALLNPRGLALALDYADGEDQPRGWSLDGTDAPFSLDFPEGAEAERFRAIEALFAQARADGRAPTVGPSGAA